MRTLIMLVGLLTVMTPLSAHPGHGFFEENGIAHFLSSAEHLGMTLSVLFVLVAIIVVLYRKRAASRVKEK